MFISIVGPTIPPGALGRDGLGFDKTGDQMLHPLGRSGNQIPTQPRSLQGITVCGDLIN